jgi:hypothetical protein
MFRHQVLAKDSIAERFSATRAQGAWGDSESVSGPGSTLAYTANLR